MEEINVGDTVEVMGQLVTKITRIEDGKYYFLDDDGVEWQESIDAIKKMKEDEPGLTFMFYNPNKAKAITKQGQQLIKEMDETLRKYSNINMKPDIGTYFGMLTTFDEFKNDETLDFGSNGLCGRRDTLDFMDAMKLLGVEEMLLDIEDGDEANTIFFKINKDTNLAELMVTIHAQNPSEFTRQDNENWFRLWWD